MAKKEIPVNELMGRILVPIDMDMLDRLVADLSSKAESLSDADRAASAKIVDEWLKAVQDRVKYNAGAAREMLSFLGGSPMGGEAVSRCTDLLHDMTGDTPEYLAYSEALEHALDVRRDKPVDESVSSDMTVMEAGHVDRSNDAAFRSWERALAAADMRYARAVKSYTLAVAGMAGVEDAMKGLRAYVRKAGRMAEDCKERAERAKINIQSRDPDTRALLHELMAFARSLGR